MLQKMTELITYEEKYVQKVMQISRKEKHFTNTTKNRKAISINLLISII